MRQLRSLLRLGRVFLFAKLVAQASEDFAEEPDLEDERDEEELADLADLLMHFGPVEVGCVGLQASPERLLAKDLRFHQVGLHIEGALPLPLVIDVVVNVSEFELGLAEDVGWLEALDRLLFSVLAVNELRDLDVGAGIDVVLVELAVLKQVSTRKPPHNKTVGQMLVRVVVD